MNVITSEKWLTSVLCHGTSQETVAYLISPLTQNRHDAFRWCIALVVIDVLPVFWNALDVSAVLWIMKVSGFGIIWSAPHHTVYAWECRAQSPELSVEVHETMAMTKSKAFRVTRGFRMKDFWLSLCAVRRLKTS
jgi:hypothetical protein